MVDWLLDLSGFWQGTGGVIVSGLVAYGIARWGHNRGQAAELRRREHQEQTRAAIELQEAAVNLRIELTTARSKILSLEGATDGLMQAAKATKEFGRVVDREAPWFSYEVFEETWWLGRPPRGIERALVSEEAYRLQTVSHAMFSRFRHGRMFSGGWSADDAKAALDGELTLGDLDLVDDAVDTTVQMCDAYAHAVSSWRSNGKWPYPLAWPAWFEDGNQRGPGVWVPNEDAVTVAWHAQKRARRRGGPLRALNNFLLRPYFRSLERSHEAERQQRLKQIGKAP